MAAIFQKQSDAVRRSKPPPPPLTIRKQSHYISKPKPKIRIIHVFAPQIIKTDVENFRELVQRLTGKPDQDHSRQRKDEKLSEIHTGMRTTESEPRRWDEEEREVVNWPVNDTTSGSFFNVLTEFDGLLPGFEELPYLPLDANGVPLNLGGLGDQALRHHHHQQPGLLVPLM